MVASSAKINRPLAFAEWGEMARALATKAAMSSVVDALF
jgi:RNA processing factor Prp31